MAPPVGITKTASLCSDCGDPNVHHDIFYGDFYVGYVLDCRQEDCGNAVLITETKDPETGNVVGRDINGNPHVLPLDSSDVLFEYLRQRGA